MDHHQKIVSIPNEQNSAPPVFTELQGQYLAFIYAYTKIQGRPSTEADMQRFFEVTPPSVHRMVLELKRKELICRDTGAERRTAPGKVNSP